MSKHNKVNPGQYYVGGPLSQDEMGRERAKQRQVSQTKATAAPRTTKPQPAAKAAKTRTAGRSR